MRVRIRNVESIKPYEADPRRYEADGIPLRGRLRRRTRWASACGGRAGSHGGAKCATTGRTCRPVVWHTRPTGFEPATTGSTVRDSSQLSYGLTQNARQPSR